jgi:hypothetical protein
MYYVKLSRKRPNYEKTKPAWTCRDSKTIFTPDCLLNIILHLENISYNSLERREIVKYLPLISKNILKNVL